MARGIALGAYQLHRPELRTRDRYRSIDDLAAKLDAILLADQLDADAVQEVDVGEITCRWTVSGPTRLRRKSVDRACHNGACEAGERAKRTLSASAANREARATVLGRAKR
jgi:hypothetical protein